MSSEDRKQMIELSRRLVAQCRWDDDVPDKPAPPDPRDLLIRRLFAALIRAHGGEQVRQMASAFYSGRDLRSIALEHGMSKSSVHRAILKLTRALAEAGVLPVTWRVADRVPQNRDNPIAKAEPRR